ncbi:hypothetical protein [Stackebrandtia nassauensis]|uniref:Uncharacterized protein n=1 Tax=Stackebrandtia nassauensis (strain DSM 44728 / CIP 108903 / NRRL B-16338 / NBRC 102104 / LLR-40K-21) TaxID=446470 RepID=D3QBC2_STANL|nr:hypothetical protein [Stackebrandtia nassauensis]ADD40939.1 hypothetical protein Snas_1229 [Stackebrandtia nassauensis DSM 44728]
MTAEDEGPKNPKPQTPLEAAKPVEAANPADAKPEAAEEKPASDAKPETADKPTPASTAKPPQADEYDVVPDQAERTPPPDFLRAGGAHFEFDRVFTSGSAAFGPNAQAVTINVESTKSNIWTHIVDTGTIRSLIECYEPTTIDATLARLLDREGLVCLKGEPNTGRKTTALVALANRHGTGQVRRIDIDLTVELNEITEETITAECGYLLAAPERSFRLNDFGPLAAIAKNKRASIVIVTEAKRTPSNFTVEHEMPDLAEVFRKHLGDQAARQSRCDVECLNSASRCGSRCYLDVRSLCEESDGLAAALDQLASPRQAFDLADEIAKVRPNSHEELDRILGDRFRYKLELARRHLAIPGTPDPTERDRAGQRQAYLVAYAAFHGESLTLVSYAAGKLRDINGSGTSTGFGTTFSSLVPEELRPEGSIGPGDQAQFKDEAMVRAFLEVMWNEYPDSQQHLLNWLDLLVTDRRAHVRARAAHTAGFFAGLAPESVLAELIDVWAGNRLANSRQAAALTCASVIDDPRVEPSLRRHLQNWVSHHNDRRLDTVARAYLSGIGSHIHLEQALRHMRIIAERDAQAESPSVPLALTALAAVHPIGPIVTMLREWTTGRSVRLWTHAARALTELADAYPSDGASRRQLLLSWMGNDPQRHEILAVLWRHALLLPDTAHRAWWVLGGWVSQASFDDGIADPVVILISQICRDSVFQRRLEFHLQRMWRIAIPESSVISRLDAIAKGQTHASVSQIP